MLGRVSDLDFVGQSAGICRLECGLELTLGEGVQVISDQRDLAGFGDHPVKFLTHHCKICFFTMLHCQTFMHPSLWLADHNDFS